jgi:AcrR family transcriptional regulator
MARQISTRRKARKTLQSDALHGPRDPRAARRESILAAALDEFSSQGFTAARLEDVARRAGIAKGTIYLYFRDKEALFQELVRSRLTPVVGRIEAFAQADLPIAVLSKQLIELFVNEVLSTQRREVIRLMIAEGRRFPKLAEFYYREVLSHVFGSMRLVLERAAARGEVPPALAEFPQLLAAPGLVAVVWTGLFDKYQPLDVRAMLQAHFDILFAARSKS